MAQEPERSQALTELLGALMAEETSDMSEEISKALGAKLEDWAKSPSFQALVRPIAEEEAKARARRIADQLQDEMSRLRAQSLSPEELQTRVQQHIETEITGMQRRIQEDFRIPLDRISREYAPLTELRSSIDRLRDSLLSAVEKEIHALLAGPDIRNLVDDRAMEHILRETERLTGKLTDRMESRIAEALSARPTQKELEDLFARLATGLRGEIGEFVAGHAISTLKQYCKENGILGREYLVAEFRATIDKALAEQTQTETFRSAVELLMRGPVALEREATLKDELLKAFRESMGAQQKQILDQLREASTQASARITAAEERVARIQETAAKAQELIRVAEDLERLKARHGTSDDESSKLRESVEKGHQEQAKAVEELERIRMRQAAAEQELASLRDQARSSLQSVDVEFRRLRESAEKEHQEQAKLAKEVEAALARVQERLERDSHALVETLQHRVGELAKAVEQVQGKAVRRDEFERFTREIGQRFVQESALETRLSHFLDGISTHFSKLESDLAQCIRSGDLEDRLRRIHDDVQHAVRQWEDNLSANYLRKEAVEGRLAMLEALRKDTSEVFHKVQEELKHYARNVEVDELLRLKWAEWNEELRAKVSELIHSSKLDLLPEDVGQLKKELESRATAALGDIQRRFDAEVTFVRERMKLIEAKVQEEITMPEAERLLKTMKEQLHAEFTEAILERVKEVQHDFHQEIKESIEEVEKEQEDIVKRLPKIAEQVLSEHPIRSQMEGLRRTLAEGLEKKVGEEALQMSLAAALQRLQADFSSQIQRIVREAELAQRNELLQQTRRLIQESELEQRSRMLESFQKQLERIETTQKSEILLTVRQLVQEAVSGQRTEAASEQRQAISQLQADLMERLRNQIAEVMQSRPTFREIEERMFRATTETRELVLKIQEEVKDLTEALAEVLAQPVAAARPAASPRRPLRAIGERTHEARPSAPSAPASSPSSGGTAADRLRQALKRRRPGW